ncbi:MAG: SusC/RagA family TonB-linked outer membrane protein [Candidatus Cryptobacteroides sp.]
MEQSMKKVAIIIICVLTGLIANAQGRIVSGTVTDPDGNPLVGVAIYVKGSQDGAISDLDGRFSLTVPSSVQNVECSCLGYELRTVRIDGDNLKIILKEEKNTLEDAIVVGYGSARKISSIVGSITTVKSETLKNTPSASALDALQGQVSGLQVLNSSGVAGDNAVSMTLHGVGSMGASSAPLYVIDGIPATSRAIMTMNPNDIKSISVLKDASATSIYGSRAANGVVYVTTKSGSFSSRASFRVSAQAGISSLINKDFYRNMMSGPELKEFWVASGIHTERYIRNTFTNKGFDADTKWYDVVQQDNNPQYQAEIAVEGGSDKISYMIGGSAYHQRGSTIGNYFDRYTLRANIQAAPKNWLKIGTNINLSLDKRQQNPFWGDSSSTSPWLHGGLSYLINPLYPTVDENGMEYPEKYPSGVYNQKYYMENNPDVYHHYGAVASCFIQIEPVKNLKIVSRFGTDTGFDLNEWMTYPTFIDANGSGHKGKSTSLTSSNTITNTIEYSTNINSRHNLSLLAGHEGVDGRYDYYYAMSSGQVSSDNMSLQAGPVYGWYDSKTGASYNGMEESYSRHQFLSFFGRAEYDLDGKYYLDASVRSDACSRFGADRRRATFWSAGAMWKLRREKFLSSTEWIDDLNLKLSYGTQGNAGIGDYAALGSIGESVRFNGESAWILASPDNPTLTWEKQSLLTLALSGRIFQRLDFDIQYYRRLTTDMLTKVPYPYTSGFSSQYDNVGSLLNQGLDLNLGVDILKNRDYSLRFSTTFNYNASKILSLFQGKTSWDLEGTGMTYVVGKPVMFYYPIYAGVDPEDGRMMWYLPGEDRNITTKDPSRVTKDFDSNALRQNTGKKRYAPVTGGFSLAGRWRGLSLQADFSYVLGKYTISNDRAYSENPAYFSEQNTASRVNDFWTPENRNAEYPAWTYTDSQGAKQISMMQFDTHLLENSSFLRLKNLRIGYSLPEKVLKNQSLVSGFNVFFIGRNILTATGFSGIDPEVWSGLTYGVAGNTKQFLFGFELVF